MAFFPDQMLVPLVFRIDGNCGITEHRFRACGGHHNVVRRVQQWISDVIELSLAFFVFDLVVCEHRLAPGTPVHHILTPVYQALLVEIDEHLSDRTRKALIEREPFPCPVHGRAERFYLLSDLLSVLFAPLPNDLEELLSSKPFTSQALRGQMFLDSVLCGYTGVIFPRKPKGVVTFHPLVANEDVVQGYVEGVSHVDTPRDVRGWNDYDEGFPDSNGSEVTFLQPKLVPFSFDRFGSVTSTKVHFLQHLQRFSLSKFYHSIS